MCAENYENLIVKLFLIGCRVHPTLTSFKQLTDAFAETRIYSTTECTPGTGTSGLSSPGFARSAPKKQKQENAITPKQSAVTQKVAKLLKVITPEQQQEPVVEARPPVKAKRQRKRKRKSKTVAAEVQMEPIVEVQPTVSKPKDVRSKKANLHFRLVTIFMLFQM